MQVIKDRTRSGDVELSPRGLIHLGIIPLGFISLGLVMIGVISCATKPTGEFGFEPRSKNTLAGRFPASTPAVTPTPGHGATPAPAVNPNEVAAPNCAVPLETVMLGSSGPYRDAWGNIYNLMPFSVLSAMRNVRDFGSITGNLTTDRHLLASRFVVQPARAPEVSQATKDVPAYYKALGFIYGTNGDVYASNGMFPISQNLRFAVTLASLQAVSSQPECVRFVLKMAKEQMFQNDAAGAAQLDGLAALETSQSLVDGSIAQKFKVVDARREELHKEWRQMDESISKIEKSRTKDRERLAREARIRYAALRKEMAAIPPCSEEILLRENMMLDGKDAKDVKDKVVELKTACEEVVARKIEESTQASARATTEVARIQTQVERLGTKDPVKNKAEIERLQKRIEKINAEEEKRSARRTTLDGYKDLFEEESSLSTELRELEELLTQYQSTVDPYQGKERDRQKAIEADLAGTAAQWMSMGYVGSQFLR